MKLRVYFIEIPLFEAELLDLIVNASVQKLVV